MIQPGHIYQQGTLVDNTTFYEPIHSGSYTLSEWLSENNISASGGSDADTKRIYTYLENGQQILSTTTCSNTVNNMPPQDNISFSQPGIYTLTWTFQDSSTGAAFFVDDSDTTRSLTLVVYKVSLNKPVVEWNNTINLSATVEPSVSIFTTTKWTVYAAVSGVNPYIVENQTSISFQVDTPGMYTATFEGHRDPAPNYYGETTCISWQIIIWNPTPPPLNNPASAEDSFWGNEFTYDSQDIGVLTIRGDITVLPFRAETMIEWSLGAIGGISPVWIPNNADESVLAQVTGLPSSNSDFGKKTLYLTVTDPLWSCSTSADFEVFFDKDATNHPEPIASWQQVNFPNWLYYWGQYRPPIGDSVEYRGNGEGIETGSTAEEIPTTTVHQWIYSGVGEGDPNAISQFLALMLHENYHVTQRKEWWPEGYPNGNDQDNDYVPLEGPQIENTSLELQEENYNPICEGYPTSRPYEEYHPQGGVNDTYYIIREPLNKDFNLHDRVYWEEQGWRKQYKGIETDWSSSDWASPGQQYGR